jgi:NAD(P)-dependent dehydrogenase (short-subunit alcohol dehydrogenase family)
VVGEGTTEAMGARWALILGVSSGFGAATARALARDGYSVFGVHLDRRATLPLAEAVRGDVEAQGRQARFWNVNAADEVVRGRIVEEIAERLGREGGSLRCLFHSLAFGTLLPFVAQDGPNLSQRQMEMTADVMAHSLVYWTQALVERGLLHDGARVFAMTSTGSWQVSPGYGAVSAAKAALEAHCRQLAYELLPRGITVNAICAGVTDTPALRKIPGHEDLIRKSLAKSPIPRLTEPDDVAGAVAALLDPRLHWLTGNVLGIHGGEAIIG